jgi:hypothetical protein
MNIYNQDFSKDLVFVENTNNLTANKNLYDTTVGENNKLYFLGTMTIDGIVKVCENGALIGLL